MKNKFMSLVLALCFMTVMSLTVFAEDVTVFGGNATRTGNTVTVTLTVDKAGATSGQMTLSYDADIFTLVSAFFGDATDSALADDDHADSINTAVSGTVTAGFASLTAADAGDVLIVVFETEEETPEEGFYFAYVVDQWSSAVADDLLTDAEYSAGTIVLLADEETEIVDKTELRKSCDEAGSLTESDYTEESWAALQEELEKAAAVLVDEEATQTEVDEANKALQAAIAALVKADAEAETPVEDETTAPAEDETTVAAEDETTVAAEDETTVIAGDETTADAGNEADTSLNSTGGSTAGTGDRNLIVLWVVAFAALAGAAVLIIEGRRQKE